MQISDIPAKFAVPFADQAGPGYIRAIPLVPTGTPGQASLQQGFPSDNFTPVSAGGVPPFGQDFNGLHNQSTAWNRWQATGAVPPYDPTWQAAVGGYPKSSMVQSLVELGLIWFSLVDDNTTDPDNGGTGWYAWSRIVTANTDLYVNGATGNDNNNGLSPATAMATIQAAVLRAYQYPPSQYTITIHVADGTYGAVSTPAYGGPALVITGNAGTPSNVIIDGTAAVESCVIVQGPNTLTVSNLKVQAGGSGKRGLSAKQGGFLITSNTVSGALSGEVFAAFGGGSTIWPGNHNFSGNCPVFFYATNTSYIPLLTSVVFTVGAAIAVSDAVAVVRDAGVIQVDTSPPSFVNPGNVTGKRYLAALNGVLNVQGAGANYFPGTVAGTTSTGGQYA